MGDKSLTIWVLAIAVFCVCTCCLCESTFAGNIVSFGTDENTFQPIGASSDFADIADYDGGIAGLESDGPGTAGFYYGLHYDEIAGEFWHVGWEDLEDGSTLIVFEGYLENIAYYELKDVGLTIQFSHFWGVWSPPVFFEYNNSDHTWYLWDSWVRAYGVMGQDTLLSMSRSKTDVPLSVTLKGVTGYIGETDEATLISFGDLSPGERAYRGVYTIASSPATGWRGYVVSKNPHGPVNLNALEITGPNEVAEDFQAQYKAIAHYDNNSTEDVTDLAVWSVEPNDIADVTAGLLTTEPIDAPQDVTITAEYTEAENTQVAQKQVSIFTICPSGSALEFYGVNDYVDVGQYNYGPVSGFTWSAWVKTNDSYQLNQTIFEHADTASAEDMRLAINDSVPGIAGFAFIVDPLGGMHHSNDIVSWNPAGGVQPRLWYHVAAIMDYTNMKIRLHINGVMRDVSDWTGTPVNRAMYTTVGTSTIHWPSPERFFNGLIDEVAIYNRALSDDEIQVLMHTRPDTDEPNLVAYWDFDEGEGEIAGDSSGNGHDGAIVGAAWVQSDAPVGICTPVAVDIRPGSCPNPLNLAGRGVLPVAILGSQNFDVGTIDAASIFLEGVPAIRSSYEDATAPVTDADECECNTAGPDAYTDLTLKFRTQDIIEQLIYSQDELAKGQTLALTLTGELFDDTGIEGTDCVVLVGDVPKWLAAGRWDANGDGLINMADFAVFAENWLQAGDP